MRVMLQKTSLSTLSEESCKIDRTAMQNRIPNYGTHWSAYTTQCCNYQSAAAPMWSVLGGAVDLAVLKLQCQRLSSWPTCYYFNKIKNSQRRILCFARSDWFSQSRLLADIPCCRIWKLNRVYNVSRVLIGSLNLGYQLIYRVAVYGN